MSPVGEDEGAVLTDATPPTEATPLPEGEDLSERRPGTTARESARARRRAAGNRLLAWAADVRTGERDRRTAARAERKVARELRRLDPGWWMLHSLPIDDEGGDVDHLLIGPAGVFVLEVRDHIRSEVRVNDLAVMVDRRETMLLPELRAHATDVHERLSSACGFAVPVRPVLVVLARQLSVKRQPEGVDVVGRHRIARWLREQPAVQSFETAAAIQFVARRADTWS